MCALALRVTTLAVHLTVLTVHYKAITDLNLPIMEDFDSFYLVDYFIKFILFIITSSVLVPR